MSTIKEQAICIAPHLTEPFYDEGETYPVDLMMLSCERVQGVQFSETQSGSNPRELAVVFCWKNRWTDVQMTPGQAKSLGESMVRWADSQETK